MREEYWDSSNEAGPATRPRPAFDVDCPALEICSMGTEGLTHRGGKSQVLLVLMRVLAASVAATFAGSKADKLQNMVKMWNEGNDVTALNALTGAQSPQTPAKTGAGSGQAGTPRRTLCTPVFEPPNLPVNVAKMGVPQQKMLMAKFEQEELLGISLRQLRCLSGFWANASRPSLTRSRYASTRTTPCGW